MGIESDVLSLACYPVLKNVIKHLDCESLLACCDVSNDFKLLATERLFELKPIYQLFYEYTLSSSFLNEHNWEPLYDNLEKWKPTLHYIENCAKLFNVEYNKPDSLRRYLLFGNYYDWSKIFQDKIIIPSVDLIETLYKEILDSFDMLNTYDDDSLVKFQIKTGDFIYFFETYKQPKSIHYFNTLDGVSDASELYPPHFYG